MRCKSISVLIILLVYNPLENQNSIPLSIWNSIAPWINPDPITPSRPSSKKPTLSLPQPSLNCQWSMTKHHASNWKKWLKPTRDQKRKEGLIGPWLKHPKATRTPALWIQQKCSRNFRPQGKSKTKKTRSSLCFVADSDG